MRVATFMTYPILLIDRAHDCYFNCSQSIERAIPSYQVSPCLTPGAKIYHAGIQRFLLGSEFMTAT